MFHATGTAGEYIHCKRGEPLKYTAIVSCMMGSSSLYSILYDECLIPNVCKVERWVQYGSIADTIYQQ
jgi:hypothetical protein